VLFKNQDDHKNGFLLSDPTYEMYESILKKSPYCYVDEIDNNITGFLFAYPGDLIEPKDEIHSYLLKKFPKENFVYIFQVAVDPKYQREGIGKKLYGQLFNDTKMIKKVVITSKNPYNIASEKFQLKLGFKKIDVLEYKNGESSFVYTYTENSDS
jgi:ribosomal protein S18 acetylase RimI-like enzyme